jgi:Restriction endonuclease
MTDGTAFEVEVKGLLEEELASGALGLQPSTTRIYHHKCYFSRDRGKDIIVDVSIELTRPGSAEPFLIWVWECKAYGGRIPVNDVEELHGKLEQIGLHRVKGTLVARGDFQESTLTYAASKGISIARVVPDGTLMRLTESNRPVDWRARRALTAAEPSDMEYPFVAQTSQGRGAVFLSDFIRGELAG